MRHGIKSGRVAQLGITLGPQPIFVKRGAEKKGGRRRGKNGTGS